MTRVQLATTMMSAGGALSLAVRYRNELSNHFPITNAQASWLIVAGVAVALGGFLLVVWELLRYVWLGLVDGVTPLLEDPLYDCRPASDAEIELVHSFWERWGGSDLSSVAQDRAWHKRNPETSWCVFEVADAHGHRHDSEKLVGNFGLLPLNKRALEQLLRGEVRPPNFLPEHLTKRSGRAHAIYLGGVAATTWRARAHTMTRLEERLRRIHSDGVVIYTRPVSRDGLRLVGKYKFVPVKAGQVGMGHLYQLAQLAPRKQRSGKR